MKLSQKHIWLTMIAATALTGWVQPVRAVADPPIAPAPQPVIGPLQAGPPSYPASIGLGLLPQAKTGVTASADAVAPDSAPTPGPQGIAGVRTSADALSPSRAQNPQN